MPVPTALRAIAGDGVVMLRWDDPGDSNVRSYQLHRGGDSFWRTIEATSFNLENGNSKNSYLVTGLDNGTTYSFRLRSKARGIHVSEVSATVTATPAASAETPNCPPTFNQPTDDYPRIRNDQGAGVVVSTITATDPDGDVLTYSLQTPNNPRSSNGNWLPPHESSHFSISSSGVITTLGTVSALPEGTSFWLGVKVTDHDGDSDYAAVRVSIVHVAWLEAPPVTCGDADNDGVDDCADVVK